MKKLLKILLQGTGLNALSVLFDNDESRLITKAGAETLRNPAEMKKITAMIRKIKENENK